MRDQYVVASDKVFFKTWDAGRGTRNHELKGADPKTFKVLSHKGFAKDKSHAYYRTYKIPNADAATFVAINYVYSKDKNAVYRNGEKITNADPNHFEILDAFTYAKDNKNVFYKGKMFDQADPVTFEVIEIVGGMWAKDNAHYYFQDGKYPLIDAASFKVLGNGYALDQKQVYYYGDVVLEADPKTFTTDRHGHGRDKNYVFEKHLKVVDGARSSAQ